MEDLKKRIEHLIEMEHRSLSMDAITPLYISRMLNAPLAEAEQAMQEIKSRPCNGQNPPFFGWNGGFFGKNWDCGEKNGVMCWWIGDLGIFLWKIIN